ncbi:MAG: hypothetical protein E7667_01950 [Ruminococcaceae bacterium]|nr:hypothetical protein [Oscillospiraceae bacterium]
MTSYIDLNKKFKRKVILRVIYSVLIGIGIFFACFSTVAGFSHAGDWLYATYGFGFVLWIIAIYNLRTVHLLFEKEWTGDIISIELRNGYYSPYKFEARAVRLIPTVYIDMIVKDEKGKNKKITYNTAFINASYYRLGMTVVHKKGSKYLIDKHPPKDKIICPLCTNTLWETKCDRCGIKFDI